LSNTFPKTVLNRTTEAARGKATSVTMATAPVATCSLAGGAAMTARMTTAVAKR
jgi:hypothetical protein